MSAPPVRRVLSIRDNKPDERLIEEVWGRDPDLELSHVDCGVHALDYLRKLERQLPNLILLAWRFQENQLTAVETLIELKADPLLRPIPVVVLAGQLSPFEIEDLYVNQVACVFGMGHSLEALEGVLHTIKNAWLDSALLPYQTTAASESEVTLSNREKEVLWLLAEDLASKEIAHRLHISARTVDFHRESIKRRIGVQGTAGMIKYAIRNGLVEP